MKVIQDCLPIIGATEKTKITTHNKVLLERVKNPIKEYSTVTLQDTGNGYLLRLGDVIEVYRDKTEGMQRYSYLMTKEI